MVLLDLDFDLDRLDFEFDLERRVFDLDRDLRDLDLDLDLRDLDFDLERRVDLEFDLDLRDFDLDRDRRVRDLDRERLDFDVGERERCLNDGDFERDFLERSREGDLDLDFLAVLSFSWFAGVSVDGDRLFFFLPSAILINLA